MVFSCLVLEVEEDGGDDGAVERLWQWPSLPCKKGIPSRKMFCFFFFFLWEIIVKDEFLMLFINLLNRYK